jgi:hypothetical protein
MRSFVKASFLAVGLSIAAFAEQAVTPTMSGDNPAIEYAGVSTCRVDASTGTTSLLCTSNPAIVYGVSASSMAANDRITLYSTNSIVLNGGQPAKQYLTGTAVVSNELSFIKPVKFPKGLVVKATNAPTAGGQSEFVIYYREAK